MLIKCCLKLFKLSIANNLLLITIFSALLTFIFQTHAFTLLTLVYAEENTLYFVDKVIAVVNKEVITWSELYKYMEFVSKDEIKHLNPDEKFKYFKSHQEEFLEKLIDTKLQIAEAERYGIFIKDEEINFAINDIKKKYGLTDEGFIEALKKEGMTLNDYKKMLKEQVIIGRAVNSLVRSKIVVTDADINSYLSTHPELVCDDEGYYISQIFIRKKENEAEMTKKINEVLKRLVQGDSFSKVASQLSEDASAKTGGVIGLLKKSEIAPILSNLFSKMNVEQISEPMMTEHGVFIFKLDGVCFKKNSERLVNYVRTIIEDEKFKKEYKLWVRSLRQRSYIEIMD